MILPERYVSGIADALIALRQPAFTVEDVPLLFGSPTLPSGVALPPSATRADCIVWLRALDLDASRSLVTHLPGLASAIRQAIRAYLRFEELAAQGSLAKLDTVLVVNRARLVPALRELRVGSRPLMRVSGSRGSGKSFTARILEEAVGTNIGGDQRLIEIDLASYAKDPVRGAAEDAIAEVDPRPELPDPTDVTPVKYLEQMGQIPVRALLQDADRAGRTWLVFDRCSVANEVPDVGVFLGHVAAMAKRYAQDPRCPRVVFLEADSHLLARYRGYVVEDDLGDISLGEVRAFLASRGFPDGRLDGVLAELETAIDGLDGRDRSEELNAVLEDKLRLEGLL